MIIALIPAREGSKRIPQKNLQMLGAYSLLGWSIYSANLSKVDRVYVSSESEMMRPITEKLRAAFIKRSEEAATDDATDRLVVLDFLNKVKDARNIKLIVYLRPTTPFRTIGSIDAAIDIMLNVPATGLRSIHEMSESAHKCFEMEPSKRLKRIAFYPGCDEHAVDGCNLPNHMYNKTYRPNGVVDIIRPGTIQKGGTYGNSVYGFLTKPVIEIDTPFDLEMAKLQLAYDQGLPKEIWRQT